ncbi:MAG: hypothetical protein EOO43_00210 [Flavobacterium sp.]|nr:MAG: hypothetical protein EOO43_00210 [Flavobacterium sp.]
MKLFENSAILTLRNSYRGNLFLKKFAGVLSVDILVKASALLLIPFYLRFMTQEEFGMYNYLLSIIQTFSLLLNFGLYIPQTKLYPALKTANEKGELLFTIFSTLLFLITLISLSVVLFQWDFNLISLLFKNSPAYDQYRSFVLLSFPITIVSFMLTNYLYASEKIQQVKTYNIYRIVFINSAVLIALYYLNGDSVLVRLGFTYSVELILLLVLGYYLVKELVPKFNFKLMWTSLKMGWPIMVSAMFGIIINFSDKFFLEKYGTLTDLSNYYLAFSFASIITLIFASLQNVWLPLFMKEQDLEKNIDKSKKLTSKLALYFAILAICIWVGFCFLLWKGIIPHKYEDVVYILPILLVTQIITALSTLFNNYLIYFEKTQFISYTGLVVSFVSLGMGLWLIPIWGVYGAAVSSLISNCIYLIIYYFLSLLFKKKQLKTVVSRADF